MRCIRCDKKIPGEPRNTYSCPHCKLYRSETSFIWEVGKFSVAFVAIPTRVAPYYQQTAPYSVVQVKYDIDSTVRFDWKLPLDIAEDEIEKILMLA